MIYLEPIAQNRWRVTMIRKRQHYNYFRDYDPNIGRYLQSDPIGLGGGLNTYSYVDGDPLLSDDPFGLKGNTQSGGSSAQRRLENRRKPKPFPMPGLGNSLGDAAGYFNSDGEFVCIRWNCPKSPSSCNAFDNKGPNDFIPATTDAANPPAGCTCDDPRYRLRNSPNLKDELDVLELGIRRYFRGRR